MIFRLLKQVPAALARFFVYRVRAAWRPSATQPVAAISTAAEQSDAAPPERPAVNLDARYLAPSNWPTYQAEAELPELLADPLYSLWLTIPNGHKWSQYFAIYRKVFEQRRAEPLRVLEIGVYLGSGLHLRAASRCVLAASRTPAS
jgi:hypothetical protein